MDHPVEQCLPCPVAAGPSASCSQPGAASRLRLADVAPAVALRAADSPMQRKEALIRELAAGIAPAVIDVEASGIGRHGYPIEIGYVLGDGRCASLMIRPPAHWTFWSDEAEQLHGVSRDRLFREGLAVGEVCALLDNVLGAQALLSDAWSFDWSWLSQLYAEIGRSPAFVLESVRRLLGEHEVASWHPELAVARARFKAGRHRAVHDAIAIQRALCRIKDIVPPEPWWPGADSAAR